MTRTEKVDAVLHYVQRLIIEIENNVPPEVTELEKLKQRVDELLDGETERH